jgi:hypothetical protein
MLGSYWQTMHPAFLLLVLGVYRLPMSVERIADGIQKMLLAEIDSLITTPAERDRIVREICNAIKPEEIPNSLRAFMPDNAAHRHEPDMLIVNMLRMAAVSGIESVRFKPASV